MGIGSCCGTEQRSPCLKEVFGWKAYQLVFVAVYLPNGSLLGQLHLLDGLLVFKLVLVVHLRVKAASTAKCYTATERHSGNALGLHLAFMLHRMYQESLQWHFSNVTVLPAPPNSAPGHELQILKTSELGILPFSPNISICA